MYITLINKCMTTYLSKNELSYDIDFAENDDYLEVGQLFDEASEGLIKYYYDDIYNVSGSISIPSTGITEWAKYMRTDFRDITDIFTGDTDFGFDNYYMYKITNAVKATHRDKIVGAAIGLPHNNVPNSIDKNEFFRQKFNDEKKAHMQIYIDNKVADAWFIEQFIVKPPFTRQGMGTKILDKVKTHASDNSHSKVSIFCYDKNTGSKTFLESQGFSVTKTIDVSSHPFFQSISVNNLHQMVCTL